MNLDESFWLFYLIWGLIKINHSVWMINHWLYYLNKWSAASHWWPLLKHFSGGGERFFDIDVSPGTCPPTPPPPSNILCFSFRFDLSVCLRKLYWCPKLLFLSYEKHDIKMKRDPPRAVSVCSWILGLTSLCPLCTCRFACCSLSALIWALFLWWSLNLS